MKLPDLTHLQFAVIDVLGARECLGRELRARLKSEYRIAKSLAAFYTVMKRLEESGFVKGRYEVTEVEGYAAKVRHYKITGKGERARRSALEFYSRAGQTAAAPARLGSPAS